jgi:hypothetical protein
MEQPKKPVRNLSRRVRDLLEEKFSPEMQPEVDKLLLEFHWPPEPLIEERIYLDILEISEGKIEKVLELVRLAKTDWRDLIMTAEYEVNEGRIVQNARGQRRLEEIDLQRKPHAMDQL